MSIAAPNHITIDENGVARIDGTTMKVIQIVKEKMARQSSPEQIQEAFPHLSLAQIHAALLYYYDHQTEIDEQIRRELAEFDRLRSEALKQDSPLRQKLRDAGHIK
jgi:uncharacterized protein (DUF433 family)